MIPNAYQANFSFWKKPSTCAFASSAMWLLAGLLSASIDDNIFRGLFLLACVATMAYTAKQCSNEQAEAHNVYVRYNVLPRATP